MSLYMDYDTFISSSNYKAAHGRVVICDSEQICKQRVTCSNPATTNVNFQFKQTRFHNIKIIRVYKFFISFTEAGCHSASDIKLEQQ
jgi:hypothetical protein